MARAYIPAQEICSGKVRIRVAEGNYGRFHLKNESLVRDDIVQAMLDDVLDRDIVSLDTLQRVMLIINDTPGVQVTHADVMPGEKVGTSDFAVGTRATESYNGYVLLDNYGSVYTGKNRLSANLDINSLTGRGEKLSLSGLTTDNGRIGYGKPLAPNGLRGEVSVAQTDYKLGDRFQASDAKGTAQVLDATVIYPVRRIRSQTVEVSGTVAYKDLLDKQVGSNAPKAASTLTAGVLVRDESKLSGFDGLTRFTFNVTVGELKINDATALTTDAAGADTNGNFSKANLTLSGISLTASLSAQQSLSGKNLDSSERNAVSGSGAVMAYTSGELIGSNATLVRLDLARPLPAVGKLQSSWLLFTNWGQASTAKPLATEKKIEP